MPLVVVVSVKYATWDLELHNLLSQVGLEDKVIPVLVDVFPEVERMKMHAALRLHGGLRFTFLLTTSATPAHVEFVLDNLKTEMVAVRGAPHIKMFSKTDYSKGVVMSVAIEQCVSIYEKLIMSADEYMQIQKSYRRFLEHYLLPAQKHLLNNGSDKEAYLAKGYNVVNLATGKMQFDGQMKLEICALSCAYRDGVFYAADDKKQFKGEGLAVVCKETLLMFDLKFIGLYESVTIGKTLPRFYWLNGPPGCGKTYMIMKNFGPDVLVCSFRRCWQKRNRRESQDG